MTGIHINRNWLIIGLVILLAVATLVFSILRLLSRRVDRPQLGHRTPIAELAYCGTDLNQLCIVSFTQSIDGSLQVNFQIPDFFYPDFILAINNNGQESTYACERGDNRFTTVICRGASQVPGQTLEFQAISKDSGTLLAEGSFAIIGIALVTPEAASTATVQSTETPTETETPTPTLPLFKTPTATLMPTVPAYPNPTSYPNPSYP